MKLKKVLAAVNDEITALQVNNLVNQPDLWELEFIQLKPELVDEILEWRPDLVIFDINLLSSLNGTDYTGIMKKHNIPFLYISTSQIDTDFIGPASSHSPYNLPELKLAVHEALNTNLLLI